MASARPKTRATTVHLPARRSDECVLFCSLVATRRRELSQRILDIKAAVYIISETITTTSSTGVVLFSKEDVVKRSEDLGDRCPVDLILEMYQKLDQEDYCVFEGIKSNLVREVKNTVKKHRGRLVPRHWTLLRIFKDNPSKQIYSEDTRKLLSLLHLERTLQAYKDEVVTAVELLIRIGKENGLIE